MKKGHEETGRKGRRESALCFFGQLRGDTVIQEFHSVGAKTGMRVFLVGGVLRNAVLGLPPSYDYDIAVEGDERDFILALAAKVGGSPFLLDEESKTWRLVNKGAFTVDAAPVKAGGITADLAVRDFTVNALALSLDVLFGPGTPCMIDPFSGIKDAEAGLLRVLSDGAFDDDPLRTLRAVRLSQVCSLKLDSETEDLVKAKSHLLSETSRERIKDELLMVFGGPGTARAVRKLYDLGVVEAILPELSAWEDVQGYKLLAHSLKTLEEVEALITGPLTRRFKGLGEHFDSYEGNVKRATLVKLAAFLHDAGKGLTIRREGGHLSFRGHDTAGEALAYKLLTRLKFGRRVSNEVKRLVRNHHRVFTLASLKRPSVKARLHFFSVLGGGGGLDLLCLALADARATRGGEDEALMTLTEEMLSFYFDVYLKRDNKPLIGGKEIMDTFGIPEGGLVGALMREVAGAVEAGTVKSKRGALKFIKEFLSAGRGEK